MSQPKPRQIWEVIYSDLTEQEVLTRPVLVLTLPSSQQTVLVTPLLNRSAGDAKTIEIEQIHFSDSVPTSHCYINPSNIYPVVISLFVRQIAELKPEKYSVIIETISGLMQSP